MIDCQWLDPVAGLLIAFQLLFTPGRLHALQTGLSIKKDREDLSFLLVLMNWLEKTKQDMKSNEV